MVSTPPRWPRAVLRRLVTARSYSLMSPAYPTGGGMHGPADPETGADGVSWGQGIGQEGVPTRMRRDDMEQSNTIARSMHDGGLAAWFGGSLFGALAWLTQVL